MERSSTFTLVLCHMFYIFVLQKRSPMTIINNTEKTFSPAEQQAIRNAMANCGVDKVVTGKNSGDGGNNTLFDFYDDNDNYLFSIDTDADGECIVWDKN